MSFSHNQQQVHQTAVTPAARAKEEKEYRESREWPTQTQSKEDNVGNQVIADVAFITLLLCDFVSARVSAGIFRGRSYLLEEILCEF